MTQPLERRAVQHEVELRGEVDAARNQLGGYALKYNKLSSDLGGFVEMIEPGFVDKSLADKVDVLARYQHDDNFLLGRVSSGTLRLTSDEVGVEYEVDLPNTDYGQNVRELARRGDLRYSSFAFRVMPDGDEDGFTENGYPLRILKRGGGQLVDVAPVVNPAYLDTSTGLRMFAERRSLDLDTVVAAAEHNQLGDLLRSKEPTVIDLGSNRAAATEPIDGNGQGDTHPGPSIRQMLHEHMAKRYSTTS